MGNALRMSPWILDRYLALLTLSICAGCMSPPHPVRCDCACGDVYVAVPSADIRALSTKRGTVIAPRPTQPRRTP